MRKFKLYAGLGGSFGGATLQGVYEYRDEQEAEQAAYHYVEIDDVTFHAEAFGA